MDYKEIKIIGFAFDASCRTAEENIFLWTPYNSTIDPDQERLPESYLTRSQPETQRVHHMMQIAQKPQKQEEKIRVCQINM